jgi:hypothetical protein
MVSKVVVKQKVRIVFWDVLPCKVTVGQRFRGDVGGSTYLWNVSRQLFYTAVHPRRQFWTSYSPLWELEISQKQKVLPVANKLDIIKKVDSRLHLTWIKLAEELGIPFSTLNDIMMNKNYVLQKGGSSEPSRTNRFYLFYHCKMFSHLRSLYFTILWEAS